MRGNERETDLRRNERMKDKKIGRKNEKGQKKERKKKYICSRTIDN